MANNLRVFNTNSEYQSAGLILPAVSYVVENDKVVYDYTPPTPEPQYRTTSGANYCDGNDKYCDVYSQVSYDEGETWETTATTKTLVKANSYECKELTIRGYLYNFNSLSGQVNTSITVKNTYGDISITYSAPSKSKVTKVANGVYAIYCSESLSNFRIKSVDNKPIKRVGIVYKQTTAPEIRLNNKTTSYLSYSSVPPDLKNVITVPSNFKFKMTENTKLDVEGTEWVINYSPTSFKQLYLQQIYIETYE